ncbi:MAG: DUF3429 domain-containing protein [Burkholderiaceae bacterium]|nr:DUF3429 domain-containing protein [Burkholderiaceae bacterium]
MTNFSRSVQKLPGLVAALGYGGLIPFLVCVLGQMTGLFADRVNWLYLLLGYGAVILSFVGALHWAFGMTIPELAAGRRQQAYLWSVVPALIGFLALAIPPRLGCSLLILGFALAYWQDIDLASRVPLPAWYLKLRVRLSVVACGCLVIGSFS